MRDLVRAARERWGWVVLGTFLVLIAVVVLVVPGVVRRKAIERARARGIVLEIRSARVGIGRITLREVQASLEGVPGIVASAREIAIAWTFSGAGDVVIDDAVASSDRPLTELTSSLDAWRAKYRSTSTGEAGKGRTYRFRNARVAWRPLSIEVLDASVAELMLEPTRVIVRGAQGSARFGAHESKFTGGATEYNRTNGKIGSITFEQLSLQLGAKSADGGADSASAAVTPVLDAPSVAPTDGKKTLWTTLERARSFIERAAGHFESGTELRANELWVSSAKGTLGPWGARVIFGQDASSFELEPTAKEGRKPIALRALVPRARGKWSAEVRLGPATLAELGVQEGAYGLNDVHKANAEVKGALEVDPDEQTLAADGNLALHAGAFSNERVADGVVRDIELSVRGVVASKGDLSAWTLTGGALQVGKMQLSLDGTIDAPNGATRLAVSWSVPTIACSDALASVPKGLMPKLEGLEMQGTFGAHGRIGFDASALDKTIVDFYLEQKCRVIKAPPALSVEKFREPFELKVYDPQGNQKVAKFGPGSGNWTSYTKISPFVIDAILTCEDGAFFSHQGFSAGAIRNAIVANLKAKKFMLGASTVSMQTAKNVFLDRRKQLSRKVQEAVLTAWLEQALTKSEILELYLNVIEFGPNLYGIGPAAWHYFGRSPNDLDPLEATFLISILPSPVKRHAMWDAGSVGPGYLAYLRSLLKEEHRRGKLDDDEYEAAISRDLVFHRPGNPLPAPRNLTVKPSAPGKNGIDDPAYDPAWVPAD